MSFSNILSILPHGLAPQQPSSPQIRPGMCSSESTSPNGSFRHNPYGTECVFEEFKELKMTASFSLTPPASPTPVPAVSQFQSGSPSQSPSQQLQRSPNVANVGNPYGEGAFFCPQLQPTYSQNDNPGSPMQSPQPTVQNSNLLGNYSFGMHTAQSQGGSFQSSSPNLVAHPGSFNGSPQLATMGSTAALVTNVAMSPLMQSADSSNSSGSPDSSLPPSPSENQTGQKVMPLSQGFTREIQPNNQQNANVATRTAQQQQQQQVFAQQQQGTEGMTTPVAYEVRVQHKHGRCCNYVSNKPINIGQHVIVDGDRGLDLGMVIDCKTTSLMDTPKKSNKVKREANDDEVKTWREGLVADEAKAMKFIKHQISKHSIPIVVHRAEFQFDRKKLTFHYTTDAQHPDFRCVLKDGYRQFRCRIWLNNCNPKGSDPGEALPIQEAQAQLAALQQQQQLQQQ